MSIGNEVSQLDVDLLGSYVQSLGIETVKKMLALYKQQSSNYLTDIGHAVKNDDAELWQDHCHKMKGAAGSVGLKSLHARLVIMEKLTADTKEKAQQLTELIVHNQAAIHDFNDWLENN